MDYSASLWARERGTPSFMVEYVAWRENMPVFKYVIMPLAILLPIVYATMVTAGLQTVFGWRRANAVRHFVDCIEVLTLTSILALLFTSLIPMQQGLAAACGNPTAAGCVATSASLAELQLVHLGLNLIMLVCPFVKYARGNTANFAAREAKKRA